MKKTLALEKLKGLKHSDSGLSESEALEQLKLYGSNTIVESVGSPFQEIFLESLKDPMIWFLVIIGAAFLFLGETTDAAILFVAILPLFFMDAILHWRTQASTSALKGQLASEAEVIRNGMRQVIPSTQIVPGDLVVLSAGRSAFLPADGLIEESNGLQVDESALTGEAFPIKKKPFGRDPFSFSDTGDIAIDSESLGFAGTRVLSGSGLLRIFATGRATSYGEIIQSVTSTSHTRTELQIAIDKLVKGLIGLAGIFCVLLAAVRIYQGHGWLDALLSAATLAIAAIPEEFPVVFTFYLGVGVYRLAKRHALVRRAVSVENIGRISVICSDKTGTITIGRLSLAHLDPADGISEHDLLMAALAASDPLGIDPVDQAIMGFAGEKGVDSEVRLSVFPFTEERKRESAYIQNASGEIFCFSKGSPETLLSQSILNPEVKASWLKKTSDWASGGHKVLACARIKFGFAALDLSSEKEPESGFEFLGLLAFEDPPRPFVSEAMDYARENGIRVLMITGDHPHTARAIAKDVKISLEEPNVVSAEEDPQFFTDEWLESNPEALRSFQVVARCTPLQKFRIVNALKKAGDLVAVTGDGVNDVPALKASDIGIAMGLRGTRSAKEVSSIILSDDNFSTIVNAIKEGRQLFENLRSSFEYLLLFHMPFILTAAIVPLMGYPLLYLPVHIVWLELIIHPTALFAFQMDSADSSNDSKTRKREFFSRKDKLRISVLGLGLAIVLLFVFITSIDNAESGAQVGVARAKVLALLVSWSAVLTFSLTGGRTVYSKVLIIMTLLSGFLLIQSQWLASSLGLSPIALTDWFMTGLLSLIFMAAHISLRRVPNIPQPTLSRRL